MSRSSSPRGSRVASRTRGRWPACCTRSWADCARRWATAARRRSRRCRRRASSGSRAPGCASRTRTTSRSSRTHPTIAAPSVVPLRPEPLPEERPVLVLDLGGQYSQLIARRVREARVYSELVSYRASADEIRRRNPVALILSGGPASVYAEGAPHVDPAIFELGVPTLGICYGMQLMAQDLPGGRVDRTGAGEFGKADLRLSGRLGKDLAEEQTVWMSHRDSVVAPPAGAHVTASSATTPIAAFEDDERHLYGIQFHPEVVHTPNGQQVLKNFLFGIAGAAPSWTPAAVIEEQVERIRARVGRSRVLCGLSGGVDSAVAALLVHKAA